MSKTRSIAVCLFASVMLWALTGARCTIAPVVPLDTVLVLLDNRAGFPVDPGLFVHPDETIAFNDLVVEENFVLLGDPPELQADELGADAAELEFACEDIGAITSYIAFLFLDEEGEEVAESIDSPDLRFGTDFVCGDEITFIYEVDEEGAFRTFVRINGELME